MKFKKAFVICLAVALIANSFGALAKADTAKKTYNYVALGDSIAAGYSLSETGTLMQDPALVLSEALIANPVKQAYPAVFGEYVEQLGQERGYETTATNLSSTAYRAQDVEQTILNAGYKGEIATMILEGFLGAGASAPLAQYHDIYDKYLTEADLVSIQLGGNDIVMEILYPMFASENPFLRATAMYNMLILFGTDLKTAAGAAYMTIDNAKDQITLDTYKEAVAFFANISKNADAYVESSANNVRKVVEAVKAVNSDADIALVGMYNPYGNSLEYNGIVYDCSTVVKNIVLRTVKEVYGIDINIEEIDPSECKIPEIDCPKSPEEIKAYVAQLEQEIAQLKQRLAEFIEQYTEEESCEDGDCKDIDFAKMIKDIVNQIAARVQAIVNIVSEESSYPLQYMIAGRSVAPQMLLLNEKLKAIADETGCTFVDVYGISNENNLDPHPTAQGHKEIADLLWANLYDLVSERMPVEEESEPVESEEESSEAPVEESTEAPVEESSEAASAEESSEATPAEESSEATPVEESSEADSTESQTPSESATSASGGNVVTGDSSPVFMYTLLAIFAVLGAAVVISFKKKEN